MPDPCRHFKASTLHTEEIIQIHIYIHTHTHTHTHTHKLRCARLYTILESVLINLAVDKYANHLLQFWQHTPELQAKLISDYGEY
jgi:hypothetical protein